VMRFLLLRPVLASTLSMPHCAGPQFMAFLLPFLLLFLALNGQAQAGGFPPVTRMDAIAVKPLVFEAASHKHPLPIRSAKEAAAYFPAPDLARLRRQVDFSRQVVLLFAWRGSGQDRLEYLEQTSPPAAVVFTYTPGLTRDLRAHHQVFVLQADRVWSVR